MQAYLVISQGNRWTDVFRLQKEIPVVIGRSSENLIVIRDDRASRRHAEISLRQGAWVVRDLGSRNGTEVNGRLLADEHILAEGDVVVVAGCRMSFVTNLSEAFGPECSSEPPDQVSSTQTVALGEDPPMIVGRMSASRWSRPATSSTGPSLAPNQTADTDAMFLYRLVFEMVSHSSAAQLAQCALDRLIDRLGIQTGGVLLLSGDTSSAQTVLAACQAPGQAYRRVSDFLVAAVLRDGGAVLARNVQSDTQLSLARESGQRETSSIICAPLKNNAGQVIGLLHVYTSLEQRMLSNADLELTIAVADNLALALVHQQSRDQLTESLASSQRKIDLLQRELGWQNEMVGRSPAMQRVRSAIERAGPTAATVLIRGESGVGKELVARAIHMRSSRSEGPLVCLNCAALAPTLLESELFGHEKGSFTGATERKIGKFEAAHGGTLLLDEIGEMIPELQAKFLRVLEGQPFERLGGNKPIQTNVRVIAATNRDLEQAVRDKQFRSDLYFRLRVVEIDVPPLRHRPGDVAILAEHFLQLFRPHAGRRIDGISPAALELMSRYAWPGNVRELRNVIERAVVLGGGAIIEPEDLSLAPLLPTPPTCASASPSSTLPTAQTASPAAYRAISLEELEKEHILATLAALGGNKSRAAVLLGVERSTLDRKLKKYEEQSKQE